MTMINMAWLRDNGACEAGTDSFVQRLGEEGSVGAIEHLRYLLGVNPEWGIWVGVRLPEFAAVRPQWLVWLLTDPTHGVRQYATSDAALAAVDAVAALWRREARGDSPTCAEWEAARAAAEDAARAAWATAWAEAAAEYASWAAWAARAAEAAAEAASAAVWASWAAAEAARAAEASVASVASSVRVAEAAAEAAAVTQRAQLNWLIELLEEQA